MPKPMAGGPGLFKPVPCAKTHGWGTRLTQPVQTKTYIAASVLSTTLRKPLGQVSVLTCQDVGAYAPGSLQSTAARWVATVPRQPVDQQGAPTSDTPCCSPWREPGAQHRGQYLPKPMAGGPDFFQRINKSVGISRRSRYTHEGFFQKDQQANLDIHDTNRYVASR